jgi:alpha/beta superfamily hydrolase
VTPIRANTVLPADRRAVTLHTADGLQLVGEIALPPGGRTPLGTLVCLHPLPTQGGSMDSHLYRKAAWRLPALADLAVIRFNTRGTESDEGRSHGEFDDAVGERYDVAAALDLAESAELEVEVELPPPWLVGWSFGTDLVLMHGRDPSIEGAILISPPLRFSSDADLDAWAETGKPLTLLVPEFDDFLRPAEARRRFARIPQAEVIAVEGAKHLFVGYTERVLDEIVARVRPGFGPLPQEYDDERESA